MINIVLYVLAVILVVFGVLALLGGSILWGILLIVLGCLVGPGGNWHLSRRG